MAMDKRPAAAQSRAGVSLLHLTPNLQFVLRHCGTLLLHSILRLAIMTDIYATSTSSRKTYIWAIPIIVLVFTFGGQILALLPAKYLNLVSRENIETYPYVLYLVIGSFTVVACIFALWIRFFERDNFASVGFVTTAKPVRHYLLGMLSAAFMSGLTVGVVVLLGGYVEEQTFTIDLRDLIPILVLLFAFILQSATEEFVFRGWMMGRIAARFGIAAGVIANSALFALMHFDLDAPDSVSTAYTLMLAGSAFMFAVFLSLLAIKEKSIWGACAWHAVWNWSFITCFGLPTTGLDLGLTPLLVDLMPVADVSLWITGDVYGPEGSIMCLGVISIASIWLMYSIKKRG